MNKNNINLQQMTIFSQKLGMKRFPEIEKIYEIVRQNQEKKIRVQIVTTCESFVESFLSQLLEQQVTLRYGANLMADIVGGEDECSVCTQYGDVCVNTDGLIDYLSSTDTDKRIIISRSIPSLMNVSLHIMLIDGYQQKDEDYWLGNLMLADLLLLCVDSHHALYQDEQKWIERCVLPLFSENRLCIAVNNAQNVSSTDWGQIVDYITIKLGRNITVFPYFSEGVTPQRCAKYKNCDISIDSILMESEKDSVSLRNIHYADLETYLCNSFKEEALAIRNILKNEYSQSSDVYIEKGKSAEIIAESRNHVESCISLFMESPTIARFNTDIDTFAKDFVCSLCEDIDASTDIISESRSLPRYISAVWEEYVQEQNTIEYEIFQQQMQNILDMIWLDLSNLSKNIRSTSLQDSIKKKFFASYSVNSFFARNIYANGGLTGILTMGGALMTVFVHPAGLLAILASEIIKITTKKTRTEELKKDLKLKVQDIIDQNAKEILKQANSRLSQVAEEFHKQIIAFYDALESDIITLIEEEQHKMEHSKELISEIDSFIS